MDARVGVLMLLFIGKVAALYPRLCKPDAENACRDYSSADKCQLIEYCKTNVWSCALASESKLCQICKADIANVQNFISANTTRDYVKYDLLALCRACPFAAGRNECRAIIDDNFNKIYDDIVSKLDPNTICRALHICQDSDQYEDDGNVVAESLGPIWLPGPVQIEEDICFTAEKCSNYSTAVKCGALDLCKEHIWSAPVQTSAICDECKAEIKKIHDWVADNKTEDEVKKELLMFCDRIPIPSLQQKCHNMIATNFDAVYKDIIAFLDANIICSALGLCVPSYELQPPSSCELDASHACLDYASAAQCNTLNYCQYVVWNAPMEENKLCNCCLNGIDKLRERLDSNRTRERVEADFLALCKLLPWQSIKFKCQTTVLHNFERIYQDVINYLNSTVICRAFFLCRNQGQDDALADAFLNVIMKYDSEVDTVGCRFCKGQIKALQDWIKSSPTKQAINKRLHDFCSHIELSAFKDECQSMISEHFDEIYDDLIADTDPDVVCNKLKICGTTSHNEISSDSCTDQDPCSDYDTAKKCGALTKCKSLVWSKPVVEDDNVCRFCEGQIKALQEFVKDNVTEADVKQRLNSFCNNMKLSAFKNECISFMDNNFEELYADLIALLDPSTVCTYLKLCNQITSRKPERISNDVAASCHDEIACNDYTSAIKCGKLEKCKATVWAVPTVEDSNVCNLCKDEITVLQNWLESKPVSDQVKAALNSFCDGIPLTAFRTACKDNVKTSFDQIYADLTSLVDKAVICTGLKLCDSISTEKYVDTMMDQLPDLLKKAMKEHKLPIRAPFDPISNCELTTTGACYDISSARLCNSVENCKQIWSRPVENGALCDMCMKDIENFKDFVNNTRDKARIALNTICNRIPVTAFRHKCLDSVKNNLDTLYNLILAEINPSVVCSSIRLCTASEGHVSKIAITGSCKRCESFVDDFQNVVFNNNEIMAAMLKLIKPECDSLDGNGAMCDMITYQMAMEHGRQPANPATVCKATNMCSVGEKFMDDICSNCKAFFKELQEEMKSNPTFVSGLVHTASEFYCLRKSTKLRKQCVKYMTMVIDVMLKSMEAKDVAIICQRVQFCDLTPKVAHDWKEFVRMTSKLIMEGMPRRSGLVAGEPCTDCKAFVIDLQTAIKNKEPIVNQLVNLVESQCRTLGELSTLCVDYIKDHYQDVLNQFAALTVDQVCDAMRMCPASQNIVNGDICTDCKAFFGDWQNLIINNRSLVNQDLDDLRTAMCSEVPSILKGECDKIFDKESGVIVTALSTQTPEQTCSDTLFCDNGEDKQASLPAVAAPANPNVEAPGVCAVCEAVMKYVDSYINYNATEKEIETLLLEACAHLPEYGKQCDDFVKNYVDTIVRLILEEGTSPLVVCKVLGLCSTPPATEKIVNGPAECDVCVSVLTELQHVLADSKIETDIVHELSKICTVIGKYKTECEMIINDYGPTILKVLAKEVDPSEVCKLIKLCQSNQTSQLQVKEKAASGVLCEVCTLVADQLDKMLSDKSTQAEIENALERVCSFLPGQFKATCDDFITANFKMIVDFLVNEMNPKVICVQLKVCPAQEVVNSGALCEVCTLVADQLDKMLSDKSTQAEIENALETVCKFLPGDFKATCDNLIKDNFDEMMKFLVNEMNPKVICVQLKLCPAQEKINSGVLCEVCTLVADQLDKMLSDKSTQAEIENALETVCGFLPGQFKTTCDDFITANFKTIVDFLVNEMNPKVICVQLKVCPAQEVVNSGVLCEVCTLVADQLDKMLSDKSTQAEIESALETVCGFLPGQFKTTCDDFITANFKTIVDFLVNEMNPKVICVQLKVCPALVTAVDNCEVCKLATGAVDDFLKQPDASLAFDDALKELCHFLPVEARATCQGIMDQAAKEIFNVMLKEMEPDVFCGDMGFCPKLSEKPTPEKECAICQLIAGQLEALLSNNLTQNAIEAALKSVCYFVPQQHRDVCVSIISLNYDDFMKIILEEFQPKIICGDLKMCPAVKVPNDVGCEVCTLAMKYLDDTLAENATQTEIEAALETVCSFLPSSYKTECDDLITTYGRMILELLIQEMKPSVICAKLGLCPSTGNPVKPQPLKVSEECTICELVMTMLDDMLSEESTEKEILAAVTSVCDLIPAQYKAACELYIKEYGDIIIDSLVRDFAPERVCTDLLHMCVTKLQAKKPVMKPLKYSGLCVICELVMKELDKVLSEESTEKEILAVVNSVCNIIPVEYKADCELYIKDYGPGVIAILIQDFAPKLVCARLHMCITKLQTRKSVVKRDVGDENCSICKTVITSLDNFLDNKPTEATVEHALEMICDMLSAVYQHPCNDFVKQYTPTILLYIDHIDDPSFVCQHLRLCPTQLRQKRLVRVCVYGPAYWCSSMATAKSCNAVQHCKDHVW